MIDADAVEKAITRQTRVIMPVQLNGRTCNMDKIQDLARKNQLTIIEDSAQALGSHFKGRYAGTFGAAGTFSFYPAKLLGCFGDGGALVTNDDDLARQVRLMRDHGRDESGHVVAWGLNSRLDNLHAALLNYKFKTYHEAIQRRREIASLYDQELRDVSELVLPPPPDANDDHFDVYQNYEIEAGRRDELKDCLAACGIGTMVQWGGTPVHQFRELGFHQNLPATDQIFERCLMLPINEMISNEDVAYICAKLKGFYGNTRTR